MLVWRAKVGRLPCHGVLDKMGMDLNTKLRPRCESAVESMDHALVSCHEVNNLWKDVYKWRGIRGDGITTLYDVLKIEDRIEGDEARSMILAVVV